LGQLSKYFPDQVKQYQPKPLVIITVSKCGQTLFLEALRSF